MRSKIAGILLIVGGSTAFAFFLVMSLRGTLAGLQRVDVPGERELALDGGGPYTVYWEVGSAPRPRRAPEGLRVSVSRAGAPVTLEPSGFLKTRYGFGGRSGIGVFRFEAPEKDVYTVTARAVDGSPLPPGCLQVGPALGLFAVLKIVGVGLILLGSAVGGGVVLLVRGRRPAAARE